MASSGMIAFRFALAMLEMRLRMYGHVEVSWNDEDEKKEID